MQSFVTVCYVHLNYYFCPDHLIPICSLIVTINQNFFMDPKFQIAHIYRAVTCLCLCSVEVFMVGSVHIASYQYTTLRYKQY